MAFHKLPFYSMFRNWYMKRSWTKEVYDAWYAGPCDGVPPHIVKQENLRAIARTVGLRVFVETGTYYGDMIEALKDDFDELYSIEVFEMLYRRAQRRFRKSKNVKLVWGDSGVRLGEVIDGIGNRPILFWLDGHCSGNGTGKGEAETPIMKELEHVFAKANPSSVVVIDDANAFDGSGDYPELDFFREWILKKMPKARIEVVDNAIRVFLDTRNGAITP